MRTRSGNLKKDEALGSIVTMIERRAFLAATSAGIGAAFISAAPEQLAASFKHAGSVQRGEALPLDNLTPEQAADVEAVAGQIMPTDDLPGAKEAGVVNFIDHALGSWAAPQKPLLLMALGAWNSAVAERFPGIQRFAQLTPSQQLEFVQANEQNPFFQQMIFVTLAGTFAHPQNGGNAGGAGWRILGFEDRYVWQPPFGWYDARANGGPN